MYSTHTVTVTVSYTDTLKKGDRTERVAVHVQYTYSTHTVTVTVSCMDILTEGG